eukprot:CAMPEP_0114696682 /NCGR_PEP_ID=MMETSP0191-20121206/72855_1 /TAXON_ID=126664 /ORGANISM="Sorites sp." /LENGTH=134 /DNA_ID=CAMNT_0001994675 /DNA_START=1215 /DNA_END=1619 /DNA_ORIENTATION=+
METNHANSTDDIQMTNITPGGDFDDINNNNNDDINITKGGSDIGLNTNDTEYLATIAEMEDHKSMKKKAALDTNIENEDALFKHVLNNEIENNQFRNDDIFNEMAFDQMVKDDHNSDDDVLDDGIITTAGNTVQ